MCACLWVWVGGWGGLGGFACKKMEEFAQDRASFKLPNYAPVFNKVRRPVLIIAVLTKVCTRIDEKE